jgi:hypothetical protein
MLLLTTLLILTALMGVVTYQREGDTEFLILAGLAVGIIPVVWWAGL